MAQSFSRNTDHGYWNKQIQKVKFVANLIVSGLLPEIPIDTNLMSSKSNQQSSQILNKVSTSWIKVIAKYYMLSIYDTARLNFIVL